MVKNLIKKRSCQEHLSGNKIRGYSVFAFTLRNRFFTVHTRCVAESNGNIDSKTSHRFLLYKSNAIELYNVYLYPCIR